MFFSGQSISSTHEMPNQNERAVDTEKILLKAASKVKNIEEQGMVHSSKSVIKSNNNHLKDKVKADQVITLTKENEKLRSQLELLKENYNVKEINNKVSNIEDQHNTIFNVITIILAAITIFGVGGAAYSFIEATLSKRRNDKVLDAFASKCEMALKGFDSNSKSLLLQMDHAERIGRLTHMLYVNNFDSDVFFADLTQLAQDPTPLMTNVATLIVGKYSNKFEQDILSLANIIIKK